MPVYNNRTNSTLCCHVCVCFQRSVPINVRRCRGESWYDGYSTYNATHYLPTFKADILSDSPSSSRSDSPYVSLPTPDNILKLHGSTLDSTSDDSEVFDQKLNHSTDSSDQNSTESLELFQPVHSADMLPWDSADPPYSFESNLSNWSPTGLTKKPLLECYSPPPVVDNNTSYITMSEALENPGFRQGLSHMENEKNFTGKPSLYPLKVSKHYLVITRQGSSFFFNGHQWFLQLFNGKTILILHSERLATILFFCFGCHDVRSQNF